MDLTPATGRSGARPTPARRRPPALRALWALLAVWLVVGSLACSMGGEQQGKRGKRGGGQKPRKEPVTVVEVAEVGPGEVAETLQATAVVEAERAASLFPAATGVILSLHADEGDPVDKGQLLAVLDNVTLDAGAERALSEVTRLEEQFKALEQLAKRGAVSDRELDDVRWQLQSARTSAREATRSYGQTRLTAPFAGVVARREGRVGELAASTAALFEIVDLTTLRVVTQLPERDLSRVAVAQPARLISAYDPELEASARVSRIAPVVDATSGTFRVTLEIVERGRLRPGQFVTVELEVSRRHDVLVVPKKAVVYEDGAPVVYVKTDAPEPEEGEGEGRPGKEEPQQAGGGVFARFFGGGAPEKPPEAEEAEEPSGPKFVARRSPVKLGLVDDVSAEIIGGLESGELAIVVGQSHLRDGARVRTPDEAAPAEVNADADAARPPRDGDQG